MGYDKKKVAEKLVRWERFLDAYHLPEWEELPKIDLYLDQVIALVNNYVGFFVYDPVEDKLLTPSMVNNYVKLRLIPAPVRKKYVITSYSIHYTKLYDSGCAEIKSCKKINAFGRCYGLSTRSL